VIAYEKGKGPRPDALFVAAEVRKGMLMKALEGNMTASEKNYTECGCKAIRDGAKLAMESVHGSLNSPLCSCVSITLPASS
jgi:hypothetical protein